MKTENLFLVIVAITLFVVASDQVTKIIALHKAGLPLFSKEVPKGEVIMDGSYGENIIRMGKISFHRSSFSKLRLIALVAMLLIVVGYLVRRKESWCRDLLFALAWGLTFGALISNALIDNTFRAGGVNWISYPLGLGSTNIGDIFAEIALSMTIIFCCLFFWGVRSVWRIAGIIIISYIVLTLLMMVPQTLSMWKTTEATIKRQILPYEYTPSKVVELREKAEELKKLLPKDMPWSITAFISGEEIKKIDRAMAVLIYEKNSQKIQYSEWQDCQIEYTEQVIRKMVEKLPQNWVKEIKTISFSPKAEPTGAVTTNPAEIIVYGNEAQERLDAVLKSILWGLSWLNSPWLDNRLPVGLRIDALWRFTQTQSFARVEYQKWSAKQIWCELFARYLLIMYSDLPASTKIIWINFSESDILFCKWYVKQTNEQ